MKILVADDNQDARVLLKNLLQGAGHKVDVAVHGADALKKARQSPPDLLISDILMPEMNGFKLCEMVKNDPQLKAIPFVFYTATYVDPEDERLAMGLGASRFIIKPVENEEFLRIIDEVVRETTTGQLPVPEKPLLDEEQITVKYSERVKHKLDKKIEELEKARRKFSEIERSYQNLFSSLRDVIIVTDLERNITDANQPALRNLFGYELEEILGEKTRILYASDEGYQRLGGMIFNREDPNEAILTEVSFRTKSGRMFSGELAAQKLKDEKGKIVGNIGIIRDITDRKRVEEFLRNIIESIGEGIAVIDRDYRITLANTAFCGEGQQPPAAAKGKLCYELLHKLAEPCYESGIDCPVKETFATGKACAALHTYPDCRGQDIVQEVLSFPMLDESGEVTAVIEVTKDVTEQKSLEAQLRQAQKMEAIGQLAGGVAHDFNNILTAIIGYASLATLRMQDDDPMQMNIGQILAAAQRATTLTQSLLAFSRKQLVKLEQIDLNALIRNFDKFLLRILREDIDLTLNCSEAALPVLADSGQIDQVLMNLATNARDAMPEGGRLTIETGAVHLNEEFVATHGYGTPGDYALITVSDSGTGMDAATKEKIFEPFFTTKELGKGTGLGLAMVFGIVKQHNGFINVYSETGQGTTFRIYLPKASTAATFQDWIEAEPVAIRGGTETILVAEDDPVLRKLTTTVLTQFGYTVIGAVDGEDAILKYVANKDRIQLVILDGIMPKKNGKQAYDEIRIVSPAVRAMFMSGYSEDEFSAKGILEKGLTYMLKPVTPSDLARRVREELDRTRVDEVE